MEQSQKPKMPEASNLKLESNPFIASSSKSSIVSSSNFSEWLKPVFSSEFLNSFIDTKELHCFVCARFGHFVLVDNGEAQNKHLLVDHRIGPHVCRVLDCGTTFGGEAFRTETDLDFHHQFSHSRKGDCVWHCDAENCNFSTKDKDEVDDHVWLYHRPGVFRCGALDCSDLHDYPLRFKLVKHLIEQHFSKQRFECRKRSFEQTQFFNQNAHAQLGKPKSKLLARYQMDQMAEIKRSNKRPKLPELQKLLESPKFPTPTKLPYHPKLPKLTTTIELAIPESLEPEPENDTRALECSTVFSLDSNDVPEIDLIQTNKRSEDQEQGALGDEQKYPVRTFESTKESANLESEEDEMKDLEPEKTDDAKITDQRFRALENFDHERVEAEVEKLIQHDRLKNIELRPTQDLLELQDSPDIQNPPDLQDLQNLHDPQYHPDPQFTEIVKNPIEMSEDQEQAFGDEQNPARSSEFESSIEVNLVPEKVEDDYDDDERTETAYDDEEYENDLESSTQPEQNLDLDKIQQNDDQEELQNDLDSSTQLTKLNPVETFEFDPTKDAFPELEEDDDERTEIGDDHELLANDLDSSTLQNLNLDQAQQTDAGTSSDIQETEQNLCRIHSTRARTTRRMQIPNQNLDRIHRNNARLRTIRESQKPNPLERLFAKLPKYEPPPLPPVLFAREFERDLIRIGCKQREQYMDRAVLVSAEPKIRAQFRVGDLVWAQCTGWPYWPGMVVIDPSIDNEILKDYAKLDPKNNAKVHSYFVQYFGSDLYKKWTPQRDVKPYNGWESLHEEMKHKLAELPSHKARQNLMYKFHVPEAMHRNWCDSIAEADLALTLGNRDRISLLTYKYVDRLGEENLVQIPRIPNQNPVIQDQIMEQKSILDSYIENIASNPEYWDSMIQNEAPVPSILPLANYPDDVPSQMIPWNP